MDALATLLGLLGMFAAFASGFFLFVVQPIWSIVDVVACPQRSTGVKVAIIVPTLVVLGPLMTILYALLGRPSPGLRRATLVFAGIFLLSVAGVFASAAVVESTTPMPADARAEVSPD